MNRGTTYGIPQKAHSVGRPHRGLAVLTGMVLAGLGLTGRVTADKVKVEPGQQWIVLETIRTKTMANEINEVAKEGFRVRMASADSDSGRMELLLERVATPPDVYQYQLVATASAKTKEKEMNAAAAAGFRLVPNTFMSKKGITVFNTESVVLMEKDPKSAATFEYKMVTALRSSNLEKDLKAAAAEGWVMRDLAYGEVVMEREARH